MSKGCAMTPEEIEEATRFSKPAASKPQGSWGRAAAPTSGFKGEDGGAEHTGSSAARDLSSVTCVKCKERFAEALLRDTDAVCGPCLRDQIESQALKTLRGSFLVQTGDRVLMALSGGVGSRSALALLAHFRSVNSERPERNKVFYDLAAIHIDESEAAPASDAAEPSSHARVLAASPDCHDGREASPAPAPSTSATVPLWTLPLHAAFSTAPLATSLPRGSVPDEAECRARLQALLSSVRDPTGREDLVRYLRESLLTRAAAHAGFNRVARGDSATLCAVRVIAESCKGRGYALPGEVQHLDSRTAGSSGAAFILPVRDHLQDDLALYCRIRGLGTDDALGQGPVQTKSNINHLCRTFVLSLQQNHPATVSTILKTAAKLQAFDFNDPSRAPKSSIEIPGIPESLKRNQTAASSSASIPCGNPNSNFVLTDYSTLCLVCRAPVPSEEAPSTASSKPVCCTSCRLQILGEGAATTAKEVEQVAGSESLAEIVAQLSDVFAPTRLRKVTEDEMREQLSGLLLDDDE